MSRIQDALDVLPRSLTLNHIACLMAWPLGQYSILSQAISNGNVSTLHLQLDDGEWCSMPGLGSNSPWKMSTWDCFISKFLAVLLIL